MSNVSLRCKSRAILALQGQREQRDKPRTIMLRLQELSRLHNWALDIRATEADFREFDFEITIETPDNWELVEAQLRPIMRLGGYVLQLETVVPAPVPIRLDQMDYWRMPARRQNTHRLRIRVPI